MADRIMDEEQWMEDDDRTQSERPAEKGKGQSQERQKQGVHKKKRKKHRRNRKLLMIPVILLILIIICMVFFRVKNLQIEGSHRVSEDEIKTVIQWDSCQGNTLLLWLLNRRTDVSSNELLAKVTVSIIDPQTVKVRVEEQSLVAGILIGEKYFYVNENGMVILSRTDKMPELPVLTGLDVEKAEAGSYLKTGSDAVLDDMLDIAECLSDYEISADTIEQSGDSGYELGMGKIQVLLGADIYMEEKISELKDLLPELAELSGTLHLENYDSTRDSIIFTKDS